MLRHPLTPLLIALSASLLGTAAQASGYHFGSQSASAQGVANANSAEAADATVVFYNPAGMTRLDGTQVSGVLNVVLPHGSYTDQGSTTRLGLSTGGTGSGRFVEATAVPHAYMTHRLNDKWVAGLGLFVPFGSKSEYDPQWSGRYNIIKTELKTFTLNPSLAYQLNDKVSLGAGVSLQYITGELAKASDFGSGAVASLGNATLNALVSGKSAYSGRVDVEGKDWGVGFNLGLMITPSQDLRIGVAYRSQVRHTLTGTAKWQVQSAAANLATLLNSVQAGAGTVVSQRLLAAYTDSDASLKVNTPDSFSVSFYKQQTPNTAVMGDLTLTRHSRFQELRVDFANSLPDSTTPERWTDTVRASLGVSHKLSDRLTLRGGIAYDQSPVTESNRTPSIPDGDRSWLSTGLNWKLDDKRSIDTALSFIHINSGSIRNFDNGGQVDANGNATCSAAGNTSSCSTIVGNYKLNSFLLGIQYNQRF